MPHSQQCLVKKLRSHNLTYLPDDRLNGISSSINEVNKSDVPGHFVECGIALGGSSIFIASQLTKNRRFLGFDVFGMIPAPSEKDGVDVQNRYKVIQNGKSRGIRGNTYYGYRKNLLEEVKNSFNLFDLPVDGKRISLFPGLFADTLHEIDQHAIAFAHIDCDWFDPTLLCLRKIGRNLSPGGIMVIDDFHDWSGCRRASLHFLLENEDFAPISVDSHLIVRRV